MAAYDDSGAVVPWKVKAGDTISKTWTVTIGGSAANFTGSTCTGAIRTAEDSSLTATSSFTMTNPTTASVKAAGTAPSTPGNYWWAIKCVMSDGTIYRGQGPLIVEPKGV